MANQDFFAEIAMTQHPIGNHDKEIPPRTESEKIFAKTDETFPYNKARVSQDYTDEERYEQFQENMQALREQYKPFMNNYIPEPRSVKRTELREFNFRYASEHETFVQMQKGEGTWEQITIPDYRGPEGKWRGYYKTFFQTPSAGESDHIVIQFQCVDYKTLVYINGNYVGGHEGFFAPFSFDITDYVYREGENELVIEVQNDYTTKGDDGPLVDGDKIYAATGPGWDDPATGWHHCPPGAGVFGRVTVEARPQFYIDDIFPRPDIDNKHVELRIGVMNYENYIPQDYDMEVRIMPKNFMGESEVVFHAQMKAIGMGKNEYRYQIAMEDFRLWTPETPYLYGAVCTIKKDGEIISQEAKHFGMRKFVSDETTTPKGKFFLNNRPVILRGANEMGHLQQCVMNGDMEQLVDDILIAKLCHMNYYRITQRPVQEEIYDYMDMLGIMCQTDLPLFSTLRRNQAMEAVKQAGEMEHLVRSHPCAVLSTFINEPVCIRRTEDPDSKFSKRFALKGHRHLYRDELEAFFVAARKMIYIENPDRVIKNVEGDYDPPTREGMPDFHTYTMWYSHHPVPVGRLARGYIPPVKEGWMIGCGEYGAEGLDPVDLMKRRYPAEWLQTNEAGEWYPTEIVRAQTNAMHGDWFEEKKTMEEWVEASQIHQAEATRIMTDAFRRRSDYIGHTAIHLLIDAWPAGWMKTLVDCERKPKKAYYAYMDALVPCRVNLRCDRKYVYAGENVLAEAWLLNDKQEAVEGRIVASLCMNGTVIESYETEECVDAAYSICAGKISMQIPQVARETILTLDAALYQGDELLNTERMEFYVYPAASTQAPPDTELCVIGERAKTLAGQYGFGISQQADNMLVSDAEGGRAQMEECLERGGNVVLLTPDIEQIKIQLHDLTIETKKGPKVYYAASRDNLKGYHFNWMYSEKLDYMDILARKYILGDEGEELVWTYGKSGADGVKAPKTHFPLVKKYACKSGTLYVVSLVLDGKTGRNANLDKFLIDCIEDRIEM